MPPFTNMVLGWQCSSGRSRLTHAVLGSISNAAQTVEDGTQKQSKHPSTRGRRLGSLRYFLAVVLVNWGKMWLGSQWECVVHLGGTACYNGHEAAGHNVSAARKRRKECSYSVSSIFTTRSDAVSIKVCLPSLSRLSLIDSLRDLSKRSCLVNNANS